MGSPQPRSMGAGDVTHSSTPRVCTAAQLCARDADANAWSPVCANGTTYLTRNCAECNLGSLEAVVGRRSISDASCEVLKGDGWGLCWVSFALPVPRDLRGLSLSIIAPGLCLREKLWMLTCCLLNIFLSR